MKRWKCPNGAGLCGTQTTESAISAANHKWKTSKLTSLESPAPKDRGRTLRLEHHPGEVPRGCKRQSDRTHPRSPAGSTLHLEASLKARHAAIVNAQLKEAQHAGKSGGRATNAHAKESLKIIQLQWERQLRMVWTYSPGILRSIPKSLTHIGRTGAHGATWSRRK